MARPFVLDTDIGTNVDDLLALLFVLGSPELDLVGVTTVSGDTGVRAAVAAHALALAGRPDVPVVAGAGAALSGRRARWAGYEHLLALPGARPGAGVRPVPGGAGMGDPDRPGRGAGGVDQLGAGGRPGREPEDAAPAPGDAAAEWLAACAGRHGGRLEIGAIAPLTNVARAARASADFAGGVRRVHLMGGGAPPGAPDHNLRADAVAAAEVIGQLDVVLCGVDATGVTTLDDAGLRAVLGAAAGSPLGRLVRANARLLWSGRGVRASAPHDPLSLVAAVRPDLVRAVTVPTSVVAAGPGEGTVVDRGPARRRVVAIGADGVAEAYRRIAVGAGAG